MIVGVGVEDGWQGRTCNILNTCMLCSDKAMKIAPLGVKSSVICSVTYFFPAHSFRILLKPFLPVHISEVFFVLFLSCGVR